MADSTSDEKPYDGLKYGPADAPPSSGVHQYTGVYTNPSKVFKLGIYNTISAAASGTEDNWRTFLFNLDKNTAGTIADTVDIPTLVKLFPDEYSNFAFSYENTYDRPITDVMGKLNTGGSLGAIKGLLEGLTVAKNISGGNTSPDVNSTKYVSKYLNIPAWKCTSQLRMPSSITFSFHFGMAGYFDAYKEVVLPIITLARTFAPTLSDTTGGMLEGPLPTSAFVLGTVIKGMLDKDATTKTLASADTKSATFDAISQANLIASNLIKKFNTQIEGISLGRICSANYGGIKIPPFTVGAVDFSFDVTEVDENGHPYKGKIILKNCETVTMAHNQLLRSMGKA